MSDLKIAILTRCDDSSPKVLAQGLQSMLTKLGVASQIFYGADAFLRRLLPLSQKPRHWNLYLHRRIQDKWFHRAEDRRCLKELRGYSAVILSEPIPNAFWRNYYDIESLRRHLPGIPILLYEVYYLANAPTVHKRLMEAGDYGLERYDWYLAVSSVTEMRGIIAPPWSPIGLDLEHSGLHPAPKKEFVAMMDFAQPGYESYRQEQLAVLKELEIPTIVLQGQYPLSEIRNLYRQATVLMMQSYEAFGIPIAECLATGALVFTPNSGWPMAWRLDQQPGIHQPGILPEIFRVYRDADDLRRQLKQVKSSYDFEREPHRITRIFRETYPAFYAGDLDALRTVVAQIANGRMVGRRLN